MSGLGTACIEDYLAIVKLHKENDRAFADVVATGWAIYPGGVENPWRTLLDEAVDLYSAHMADDRVESARSAFEQSQKADTARELGKAMERALREFTKAFTEDRLAKHPEHWERIRHYYATDTAMVPAGRCEDLRKVYETFSTFLGQLSEIAQLMERSRWDLFQDSDGVDLPGLTAEMSYWSEYVGQWFNHIWSSIPVDGSPVAQAAAAQHTAVTHTTSAHDRGAASRTASAGSVPSTVSPALPTTVGQQPPAAAIASSPLVPRVEKARSRKSAEHGVSRNLPLLGRLVRRRRETADLGPDAERIADALKYNRMTMLLLLRRVRKDTTGGGVVKEFRSYATRKVPWAGHLYPGLAADATFTKRLDAVEDAIEKLREYEKILRGGASEGFLVHVADAAEECNIALREVAKHINGSVPAAVSPLPAAELLADERNNLSHEERHSRARAVRDLSQEGAKACYKVGQIIMRINQITADQDFTRKHLSFQGIERITGYAVRQDSVSPTCVKKIEDAIAKAEREAARAVSRG